MANIDDIVSDFELIDDWEERYRYVIELGRDLEPFPEDARTDANKVRGCASQVWLETAVARDNNEPVLNFRGDSDAHIVRGLIYLLLVSYSGRPAREVAQADAESLFAKLGLGGHLTPQRSNGVRSMVERMKADAKAAMAGA